MNVREWALLRVELVDLSSKVTRAKKLKYNILEYL